MINSFSANTRTGAFGKRLSNHNGFLKTKDSHKFEGCFLRGQVSSYGFKVFNSFIVEH